MKLFQKVRAYFHHMKIKASSYFPTRLPRGMTEFNVWYSKIVTLAGSVADEDSMRFTLAAQILSLKPNASKVPLNEFVKLMHKAASNEIASAVFRQIKQKQLEAAKAAQPADTNETTQDAQKA